MSNDAGKAGQKGGLYGTPGGLAAAAYNRARDTHVVQPLSHPYNYGVLFCVCPEPLDSTPIGECRRCRRKPLALMSPDNQEKYNRGK